MNNGSRHQLSRYKVCLVLSALLFSASCSSEAHERVETPQFTIENVESTWLENRRMWQEIEAAAGRLKTDCAIDAGATEEELPPPPDPDLERVQSEAAMGLLKPRVDVETAEEVGYVEHYPGLFESEDQDDTVDSSENYVLKRDVAVILYGSEYVDATWDSDYEVHDPPGKITVEVPEGDFEATWFTDGCVGEVTDYLHQGEPRDFLYSQTIATASMNNRVETQDEYTGAQADWLDCMYDRGYEDLTSFRDVLPTLVRIEGLGEDLDPSNPEHIKVAVADAECTSEHDINERSRELFESLLLDYYEDNEIELYSYHQFAQEVLNRAQTAIHDGGILGEADVPL